MNLHVLVDNTTLIDRCFCAEPGASYFIQDGERTVLFDVGYLDAFVRNARKMAGIDAGSIHQLCLPLGTIQTRWSTCLGMIPQWGNGDEALMTTPSPRMEGR